MCVRLCRTNIGITIARAPLRTSPHVAGSEGGVAAVRLAWLAQVSFSLAAAFPAAAGAAAAAVGHSMALLGAQTRLGSSSLHNRVGSATTSTRAVLLGARPTQAQAQVQARLASSTSCATSTSSLTSPQPLLLRPRTRHSCSAAAVQAAGAAPAREQVFTGDAANNVSEYVYSKMGMDLHRQRDHPIGIIKQASRPVWGAAAPPRAPHAAHAGGGRGRVAAGAADAGGTRRAWERRSPRTRPTSPCACPYAHAHARACTRTRMHTHLHATHARAGHLRLL